ALQRSAALKNEVPRVIRPDVLLTESGLSIIELDSVPGGIGLTAWLNQTYSLINPKSKVQSPKSETSSPKEVIQAATTPIVGPDGMLKGFAAIFGEAPTVHVVVSAEAATYRPEMAWLCQQLGNDRFKIQTSNFDSPGDGLA